ncbi:MAG: methyltransferase domain-containing protein [Methylobacteriaceae bacterium]|nr:methyltransferase domain-containing protein [Methylobacteriaceae bacterium]
MLVAYPAEARADPAFDPRRLGAAAFVLSLRERGVFAVNVLRAMETVPREHFAPRRYADLSREDIALPLPCGQTMCSPATVAAMLAALDMTPGQRVLEIGTGSGYVSALLARMGADVHSIERLPTLAESAAGRLALTGLDSAVRVETGDGLAGPEPDIRFDRILLNGAVPSLRPALLSRLAAGGRLVGGLLAEGRTRLLTIDRDATGRLSRSVGAAIRLPPLVEGAPLTREGRRSTES